MNGFWQMFFVVGRADQGEENNDEEIKDAIAIGSLHLQIWPRENGLLSVLGIRSSAPNDDKPVSWVQADAHASEIDGEVYYNLKLRAVDRDFYSISEHEDFAGFRFDQEIEQRFIILRANLSDEDKLFLHFMNPYVLRDLIKKGRISGLSADCSEGCGSFSVVDASRDELVGLIRELGSERLFIATGLGPFHRAEIDAKPLMLNEYLNWMWEGEGKPAGIEY
jgi:hypothetical protein